MGIYHWKLGDIALARISKNAYAKVIVVKNEKGLFYDDKVLGMNGTSDGGIEVTEELCYYVEICRSGEKLWLPYTCMYLAERSRPFYGTQKSVEDKEKPKSADDGVVSVPAVKRKSKEEHPLPLDVKTHKNVESNPDLNITYESRATSFEQGKYENAFNEFMRRGKDMMFDYFYEALERDAESNSEIIEYVRNVNASTEDKFEMVIRNFVSEKEVDNHLRRCWRYNWLMRGSWDADDDDVESEDDDKTETKKSDTELEPIECEGAEVTVHISWCVVCGAAGAAGMRECRACPAAFHPACRPRWPATVQHRKAPPQKQGETATLVKKILSSTRAVSEELRLKESDRYCPSCLWGPKVGYDDIVWYKQGTCSWWPARVLRPGAVPACLLARARRRTDWPIRYYGTGEHAWARRERMCLFLPPHAAAAAPRLHHAVMDACDDYIAVYLA